jgi:hypothetical protein
MDRADADHGRGPLPWRAGLAAILDVTTTVFVFGYLVAPATGGVTPVGFQIDGVASSRRGDAGEGERRVPDIVSRFRDMRSNPFRGRWANRFFQVLSGSLAALLRFLMPRSPLD